MGYWRSSVYWKLVKKGIGVSCYFLLSTLALRSLKTLDLYWLEPLGGIDMVAAYVLMLGAAGTVMNFLDAGVFTYAYPALIQHHLKHEHAQARASRICFDCSTGKATG